MLVFSDAAFATESNPRNDEAGRSQRQSSSAKQNDDAFNYPTEEELAEMQYGEK